MLKKFISFTIFAILLLGYASTQEISGDLTEADIATILDGNFFSHSHQIFLFAYFFPCKEKAFSTLCIFFFASMISKQLHRFLSVKLMFTVHNTERAIFGMPNMTWDSELAMVAQNFARMCQWGENKDRTLQYQFVSGKPNVYVGMQL
jgi:hypothetical protein